MAKGVSEKSTKTEILEAYNSLLLQAKEQKAADQKAVKKETEEKEVVKSASQNSVEEIVKRLASLKLEIVKNIDSLEENLIAEYRRFVEFQQAIDVQAKSLEEIYGIQAEAESLTVLINAQKEKKDTFEAEAERKKAELDVVMNETKLQWKKEQEEYETAKKEKEGLLKKERQREEEDYSYNLQLTRKKDADTYEAKKVALEKELTEKRTAVENELSEREATVASKEKELEELGLKVGAFPKELDRALKETEKSVSEKIELKYKYQTDLAAKEIEGDRKLSKQIIDTLEGKIKEQEEQIKQLTQKADDSVAQVQKIAVKAIEGASSQRVFVERSKENG
jgi:hypothetical protein